MNLNLSNFKGLQYREEVLKIPYTDPLFKGSKAVHLSNYAR